MTIVLGAQTHFSQGWSLSLLDAAHTLGAGAIRDSLPWHAIETVAGRYDFSVPQAAWLDQALERGLFVTLTFANANILYDKGFTVHSDAGREAFANFVVASLKRYPGVGAVEIGNEYNSNSFVTGPIAGAGASYRDDYYAKLVAAVDTALTEAGIHVELVGGATHSIPVDYFADLKALGTLDILDTLSIHPYTTPPEQFADQIAVLRDVVGGDLDIRVTEFGGDFVSLEDAPAYFAKMLSVMGAAGIESASWYALARQWNSGTRSMEPPLPQERPFGFWRACWPRPIRSRVSPRMISRISIPSAATRRWSGERRGRLRLRPVSTPTISKAITSPSSTEDFRRNVRSS